MSDEEFEKNVEAAVSAIAESNRHAESSATNLRPGPEKATPSPAEVTPRNSLDTENHLRKKEAVNSGEEDSAAVTGLLRTIQKPLTTIGRMFSDESDSQHLERQMQPVDTPRGITPSRPSAPPPLPDRHETETSASKRLVSSFEAQDAAARQASAEAAEARRISRAEHDDIVEYVVCSKCTEVYLRSIDLADF